MENYPGNSHESRLRDSERDERRAKRQERRPTLKVVTGEVTRRKKTIGSRFVETFGGGNARGVIEYVIFDVLLPDARSIFAEAVKDGIDRFLYGDGPRPARDRRSSYRYDSSDRVNYNRYSSYRDRDRERERDRDDSRRMSKRARAAHDFDEIVLASRVEANEVLRMMSDILESYDSVSVKDFYDLVGEDHNAVDENWGWTNLRDAEPRRLRNGRYVIDLPRPKPLD